jgi:hypothetical protein
MRSREYEILKKYIRHVYNSEGVDFLEDRDEHTFSEEEWDTLKAAQAEVIAEDENATTGNKKDTV